MERYGIRRVWINFDIFGMKSKCDLEISFKYFFLFMGSYGKFKISNVLNITLL